MSSILFGKLGLLVGFSVTLFIVVLFYRSVGVRVPLAPTLRHGEFARHLRETVTELIKQEKSDLSLTNIAAHMDIQAHTLRRRLKEENTSFQETKDSLLKELAIQLLTQENHSIQTISDRLGYSEPRSFNRAFQNWTGLTPHRYRTLYSR